MAYKVYRKEKRKLGLLTEKQFFEDVAVQAGYMDEAVIRHVYNAMSDILFRELRTRGALRFPRLCDFHLMLSKGKRIQNYKMAQPMYKPPHHQLRIRPMYTIKKYFKEIDINNPGVMFDPVERLAAESVISSGGNVGHGHTDDAKFKKDSPVWNNPS